jgi:ATP-dependent DNA ligase
MPHPITPTLIKPMLVSLRHELPADEESYGWELKWDGLRAIAYVSQGTVRLVSRNDKDMAASYPELGVLAERAGTPVILDGEIVALRHGRPDFGLLQSRMHVLRPDDALLRRAPVQSLLLGVNDGGRLRYAGHVGTGFTRDMLTDLGEQLASLGRDTSPFGTDVPASAAREARWVEPRLVGEVAFAEWTADGFLRQPSWRGLRIDKDPAEVRRED